MGAPGIRRAQRTQRMHLTALPATLTPLHRFLAVACVGPAASATRRMLRIIVLRRLASLAVRIAAENIACAAATSCYSGAAVVQGADGAAAAASARRRGGGDRETTSAQHVRVANALRKSWFRGSQSRTAIMAS